TLNGVHVYGYISKPVFARANRNMQNFFINGRYVKSTTASAALENACKGSVMVGKFPSCVMNIDLSYEAVDVNVHPTKIEVRFINERPIFDAVYHAVKTALLKGDERKQVVLNTPFTDVKKPNPFEMAQKAFAERKKEELHKTQAKPQNPFEELDSVFTKKNTENQNRPKKQSSFTHTFANQEIDSFSMADSEDPLSIYSKQAIKANEKKQEIIEKAKLIKSEQIISDEFSISENKEVQSFDKTIDPAPLSDDFKEKNNEPKLVETSSLRLIGEAFSTYIIVEKNSKELLLIDKHAAHERMIYEKLKKEKGTGFSQMLITPVTVTLNKIDYNNAIENLNLFSELGFDVENFGNGVLLVRSAPQYLENVDISETITEIAGYISENKIDINTEKMDFVYHNIACRAAIKAGAKSTPQELMVIVNKLESDNTLRYCPHGRPVCIVLSKYEIEKQFGRV
ncbi:MAG: DNA mismatch repair endonuclease MutL, partial [Acutalibacteraceae bacterium]